MSYREKAINLTERYGSPVYVMGKCITGHAASSDGRAHGYEAWSLQYCHTSCVILRKCNQMIAHSQFPYQERVPLRCTEICRTCLENCCLSTSQVQPRDRNLSRLVLLRSSNHKDHESSFRLMTKKCKVIAVYAMRAQKAVEVYLHSFLTFGAIRS